MRVLHLFSNYKWTGPAEPAVNVCLGLRKLGIEADFACSAVGDGHPGSVAEEARDRGVAPILEFKLSKTRNLDLNFPDIRKLRAYLQGNPYDLIHCHMQNDHGIAVGGAGGRLPVIRSSYQGEGIRRLRLRTGWRLQRTAFLIEPSHIAMQYDRDTYHYPEDRMQIVPASIDTVRFNPDRNSADLRATYRIPEDAFVLGIVARMQRHRLFHVLLEALRQVISIHPEVRLIIVGRGTHQKTVARDPVDVLGLSNHVHFAGYVSGETYVKTLNTFDMKVFMTPGTDGTCRAVREAMAMGKPAIVNRVGMLPELVEHGETGFVFDGTVDGLVAAIREAVSDRENVKRMGENAREVAHREFPLDVQAKRVAAIYERVLSGAHEATQ